MTDREIREFDSYARSNVFAGTIAAENAPGSVAAQNFDIIAAVVAQLSGERSNQVRHGNTSKEVIVRAVALELQNIHRTAIGIALSEPGFADTFHLPASANERDVVASADAFLKQLAPEEGDTPATLSIKSALANKFLAHDMNADFVAHLKSDRQDIADANKESETKHLGGVGNTALVGPALKRAGDAVTVLNAIMHNRYANQPDKLAAWLTASHVERDPKRSGKKPGATGTTPA